MTTRQRVGLLLGGVFLYACFLGLGETASGLSITFPLRWTGTSPSEAYVWVGTLLLLTPAGCLLGVALAPWLVGAAGRVGARVEAMTPRERRLGAVLLACATFALASAGNAFFLRGLPFTDDEWAARFGGQVLAMGRALVPRPQPWAAFPDLFLYGRDGLWTSFDWLGVQLAWAAGELSGLGGTVFPLIAALGVFGVLGWGGRRHGAAGALLTLALYLASPLVQAVSFTTHAHVVSRTLLALGLWAFIVATERRTFGLWFCTGLVLGLAAITRPFEVVALTAPLLAAEGIAALRRGDGARTLGGLVLGLALPLAAMLLHDLAVTGSLLPPRLVDNNEVIHPYAARYQGAWTLERLWNRFGANLSYNLVMLALWFLGPVGLVLVAAGLGADRVSRLLGWGVAAHLGLALLHDDHGLHMVGPIHYADAAVPLTFIATAGLLRLVAALRARSLPTREALGALTLMLVLAMGTFTVWNGMALRRQAATHESLYALVDDPELGEAVVLAPPYGRVWRTIPVFAMQGGFVNSWPRVRPDLSERVLVLHDAPGAEPALRALLPGRRFYRLQSTAPGEWSLAPLPEP